MLKQGMKPVLKGRVLLICLCLIAVSSSMAIANDWAVLSLQTPPLWSEYVREVQEMLANLSFYKGTIDGVYGRQTATAVAAFQGHYRLPVTGEVDDATWYTMTNLMRQRRTTESALGPEAEIVIDTAQRTLSLVVGSEVYRSYPVAVGRPTPCTQTPLGRWQVTSKQTDWGGGFGTRWLRLSVPWGSYGIHGTNKPWSIGQDASSGCIRMFNLDVEELFELVSIGVPVTIVGAEPPVKLERKLKLGMKGRDVLFLQCRLLEQGFDPSGLDGVFGPNTEASVRAVQERYGIKPTGVADVMVYDALRLSAVVVREAVGTP